MEDTDVHLGNANRMAKRGIKEDKEFSECLIDSYFSEIREECAMCCITLTLWDAFHCEDIVDDFL